MQQPNWTATLLFFRSFVWLRFLELIFAFIVLLVVFPLFGSPGDILDTEHVVWKLTVVSIFSFTYLITFLYLPFSFLVFVIAELIFKMPVTHRKLLNPLTYAIHSLPFMWMFGLQPFAPDLWLVWVLIIIFDFFAPQKLMGKRRERESAGIRGESGHPLIQENPAQSNQ